MILERCPELDRQTCLQDLPQNNPIDLCYSQTSTNKGTRILSTDFQAQFETYTDQSVPMDQLKGLTIFVLVLDHL